MQFWRPDRPGLAPLYTRARAIDIRLKSVDCERIEPAFHSEGVAIARASTGRSGEAGPYRVEALIQGRRDGSCSGKGSVRGMIQGFGRRSHKRIFARSTSWSISR